jgi:gamma-glutamylcyclotransferase (GGCT)/AIG2-like uncharacterized protein YtfP
MLWPELPLSIFVYGTLKPGGVGYQQFLGRYSVQSIPAVARGQLYDLPAGYPAMTVGDGWVQGVVLGLADPSVLAKLDAYEDYDPERPAADNLYYRTEIEVFAADAQAPAILGRAWVYLMQPSQIQALGGHYLASGNWVLR